MRQMPARRTDEDCTVREDPDAPPLLHGSARIVIASTRAADGTYEDRTGPRLERWLCGRGLTPVEKQVVADGPEVGRALAEAIADGVDVVITSGGTGISPTDVTPEQTAPLIEREMPGILEAVRRRGESAKATALLSRGIAGMAGRSFVANLPGSRGGVKDGIAVIDPLLDHLLEQRDGGDHGPESRARADGADDSAGSARAATTTAAMSGTDPIAEATDPATPSDQSDPTRGTTAFPAVGADERGDAQAQGLRIAGDPAMGEAPQRVRHAAVGTEEITVAAMAEAVADPRCGAVVTFDGVVRDHDGGRGVDRLEYTSHPSAPAVIAEVAAEIAERYPDVLVAVAHRVGPLAIGDSALVCAIAAPHRKQAFVACDELVDTVKLRVPIWKHQVFDDGASEWVGALG
ncbi:molybdenum cofactor biosynthesis protein MoaE [Brachybacterium sp. sponge]|uniref:molybdenum cofactor biosynthesis protein MoaE n=1 Tax=Brachybacterium sp. sponge TaxID=1775432 RepID=UPI0009EF527A|nr:molybdenum cofactor biosynthesis protein MoaE [Brachybacterium sp. sponge]